LIKKSILKEQHGRLLVRVDFKIDVGQGENDAALHEFWISREAFEESQKSELAPEEPGTGNQNCRAIYNLSDEEAIKLFSSLQ
jgi:hypothetical protein